jgi:hypothetical protein
MFSNYQELDHVEKAREATKILCFNIFGNEGHNALHTRYKYDQRQ